MDAGFNFRRYFMDACGAGDREICQVLFLDQPFDWVWNVLSVLFLQA